MEKSVRILLDTLYQTKKRGVLLPGDQDLSSFNENLSAFQYNLNIKSRCPLGLYCAHFFKKINPIAAIVR